VNGGVSSAGVNSINIASPNIDLDTFVRDLGLDAECTERVLDQVPTSEVERVLNQLPALQGGSD